MASLFLHFSYFESFRSHHGPGVDSASNRNEYQEHFLGDKFGRCVRLTTLSPSCAVVMKSGNPNFLEPSGPLQTCNGTALPLLWVQPAHLYYWRHLTEPWPSVVLVGLKKWLLHVRQHGWVKWCRVRLGELEILSPSQRLLQSIKQTNIKQTSRWQEALWYSQVKGLLCYFKRTSTTLTDFA